MIEQTTPVSPEESMVINKKNPSRKVKVRGDPKDKTRRRRDIKKRRLLIVESDSTEQV